MGSLRGGGIRCILLTACLGITASAHAACTGPQTLTVRLHDHPTTENFVQLGSWFAGKNQFECAIETFRTALKADPQSAELNYLEALALVGAGKPAAAVPPVQESIRLQPKVIKPHLLLATIYDQSGKPDEADEQWRLALAIDPHSEIALEGLSGAMLARKDYIGVIGLLQNAPRTETLTLHLAEALEALNYFDGAHNVILEALKTSPDSMPLIKAESVILVRQRSYLEATKLWRYTVDHHPGDHDAELNYLRILVMTQHYALAQPLGVKLLALAPHNWEVLYLNGVEDRENGDYVKAKAHLEEAVSLVPDFYYSRFHLGVTLVALHEWKEAKENLEKVIALGDTDPKAHYELAMALHGLGENDRAAQEIQQYQDLQKSGEDELEASSHVSQADEELTAGKLQEAVAHYREACDEAPQNAGYRFKYAIALQKAGDLESERTQLEEAVKLDPKLAGAQKQLGYLLARSGDATGAIEHFQLAVQAAPAWADAWINLGGALAEAGQYPEARKAATMALRLDPGNAQAQKLNDQLARDPAAQQANP